MTETPEDFRSSKKHQDDPSAEAHSPRRKRFRKRVLLFLVLLPVLLAIGVAVMVPRLNRYQTDGVIRLAGPQAEITIVRDEKGMPFIQAGSLRDVIFGQGFVTAQDRLFQIHLLKLRAAGRLTELAGDAARDLDVQARTIGFRRVAEQHEGILDEHNRQMFQTFADGINAFVESCPGDVPLEFRLAGLTPEQWTPVDSLSLLYLMSWDTSANVRSEIISQALIDAVGPDRAAQIFPINVNPDVAAEGGQESVSVRSFFDSAAAAVPSRASGQDRLNVLQDRRLTSLLAGGSLHVGSNNWVTGPSRSVGEHAILSGDPHLDPRMLPGIMYAVGFFTPEIRAVGAGIPGIPGFIIGRNEFVATAVTNNYGDVQDLYVETVDPNQADHYLEGGQSVPFRTETETLQIKDASAAGGRRTETLTIRFTRRGPVVSGILPGLDSDRLITLRWAAAESMQPDTGLTALLTAKSVDDVEAAIASVTSIVLNFVFADASGNIARRASGKLPQRTAGTGTLPTVVDARNPWTDNWQGWIPFAEMPHARNPDRGWLGTANHYVVAPDYPYYYSNYAAASFRYRRLKQCMAEHPAGLSVDDHWAIQRDTKNLMAEAAADVLADALDADETTRPLADVLRTWNRHDTVDQAGPTVFQTVYCETARATFRDDLGDDLTDMMLGTWYYWQERFLKMVLDGRSPWFDDQTTADRTETRDDIIRQAGRAVLNMLAPRLGPDPSEWHWGRVHTIRFDNPIRRSGVGRDWLGTADLPMDGSGETLYRGWYDFDDPHRVTFAAALRMVVDFGDSDKVRAVLAGGSTGRTFHPHQKDQIDAWLTGTPQHWWFSDRAVQQHAQSRLKLVPAGGPAEPAD